MMLAVSPRWAPAIAGNHTPVIHAEVWKTTTRLIADLPIESGTITKDAAVYPRVTANLQIADTTSATAQLCTVFGSRIKLYRGLTYPDNTAEYPLIGDLDIIKARFERPANALTVTLADPSALVARDLYSTPANLPNVPVWSAIQQIIWSRTYYGDHTPSTDAPAADTVRTPPDFNVRGDPWDAIEQLADGIGAECYFTPDRQLILRPEPTIKPTPDATLYALDGGTVTGTASELDRAPNVVYLWGAPDATGKQIRGVAWDSAVSSPTYVGGAYGRVVAEETRPTPFASVSEANIAAANMLSRLQRGVRTVTIECVPNPAIEPGDTVRVRFVNGALETHLVTAVEIPLGPADRMTVSCATTTYTTAGWV